MIENQDELRTALEKNREQMKQIKLLESEKAQRRNEHLNDNGPQLEELQRNVRLSFLLVAKEISHVILSKQ